MNEILPNKTIPLLLAFMMIIGTITITSVYGQSNSPFVTKSQLQAALADVVTQDDLQAALADVVTQDDLQAALADVVTQDDLQAALADVPISSTNIYTVQGPFVNSQVGQNGGPGFASSIARCNTGDTVLSGSYFLGTNVDPYVIEDHSLSTQDGWRTTVTGNNIVIKTYAQCYDNP